MLEDIFEKVWCCLNRITPSSDKKPPDKYSTTTTTTTNNMTTHNNMANNLPSTFKSKLNANLATGPPTNFRTLRFDSEEISSVDGQYLEDAFQELLHELDLSPEKQAQLSAQSAQKKWLMIVEQNTRKDKALNESICDEMLNSIDNYVQNFPDRYSIPLAIQQLEGLAISLRTESFSYVQHFLNRGGGIYLVELLNESRIRNCANLAASILSCFRVLLNSSIGRKFVVNSSETTLLAIAGALDLQNSKCKILSLEILSGLCLTADSCHRAVLKALTDAQEILGERTRFQKLVDDLHREYGINNPEDNLSTTKSGIGASSSSSPNNNRWRETERVRISLMSLINALLKSGPAEHSLEFRLHLRYEFLMLGLQEVIDRLRRNNSQKQQQQQQQIGSTLEDHFDLFEMMRQEDEQELCSQDSGASSPVDFESPAGMAEALSIRLDNTIALTHLISLLQHLLMIPGDSKHLPLWRLFDLILQQLSMQIAMGVLNSDPQLNNTLNSGNSNGGQNNDNLRFDMNEIISRLRTQIDYEKLEKELLDTQAELETERQRALELENRLGDLQDGLSLSSFSRNSDLSTLPSDPYPNQSQLSTTDTTNNNNNSLLPPIRPPTKLAPPPPPPPPTALQLSGKLSIYNNSTIPKKSIPKPQLSLKTLNWTPIHQIHKLKGTIWEKMDDEKLYKQLNLTDLATNFAATSSTKSDEHDGGNTLPRCRLRANDPLQVSVIEPRRAQNCTIMLSKLKLSHREIRNTVMSMDEKGRLPKDMIEQMLKYIPTKEELQLLRETVQQHKSAGVLALADRYLYEVGQIFRYEQRLKCLYTIRTFHERVEEITPYLNAVIKASNTLYGNKKLKQFLALVLAIGNYLNYGKRTGNAYGFSINSLSLIHGVRSSTRADRNLMHFIVETAEKKFPDLLRLKRELSTVYEASKFNRVEMEAEFRLIEASLKEVGVELIAQKKLNETSINSTSTTTTTSTTMDAINSSSSLNPINNTTQIIITGPMNSPPDEPKPNQQQQQQFGLIGGATKLSTQRCVVVDQFVPVVTSFLESARKTFRETQLMHREMEEKFSTCTKYYAQEDNSFANSNNFSSILTNTLPSSSPSSQSTNNKCSPDIFFGAFSKCFNQFADCYQAIWEEREEIERTKRQTIVRTIFAKKSRDGKKYSRNNPNNNSSTISISGGGGSGSGGGGTEKDFETLVHALQSGELFSKDLSRLRTSIRIPQRKKSNNNSLQQQKQQQHVVAT